MTRIVVDSDVLIDFLRRKPGARTALAEASRENPPGCSVITVAEIRAGMRPEEEAATFLLLDAIEVLPVDRETALLAGQLKQTARSRDLELDDCLIAATALLNGAALPQTLPSRGARADSRFLLTRQSQCLPAPTPCSATSAA